MEFHIDPLVTLTEHQEPPLMQFSPYGIYEPSRLLPEPQRKKVHLRNSHIIAMKMHTTVRLRSVIVLVAWSLLWSPAPRAPSRPGQSSVTRQSQFWPERSHQHVLFELRSRDKGRATHHEFAQPISLHYHHHTSRQLHPQLALDVGVAVRRVHCHLTSPTASTSSLVVLPMVLTSWYCYSLQLCHSTKTKPTWPVCYHTADGRT